MTFRGGVRPTPRVGPDEGRRGPPSKPPDIVVRAGEVVTVPKEWTGIWETDGYTKIWVIYSADGSGLE